MVAFRYSITCSFPHVYLERIAERTEIKRSLTRLW
jgi:hypothetical protein